MIAAAGNGGLDKAVYPAAYSSVISAGSLTDDGVISPISNFGTSVDLFVNAAEGTSYAAQYVAADAVKYMQEQPNENSEEVRLALTGKKFKECTVVSSSEDSYVYAAACSHSLKTTVISPTCTAQGYTLKKCTKSGCSYSTKTNYTWLFLCYP